jgi:hypothetical protein
MDPSMLSAARLNMAPEERFGTPTGHYGVVMLSNAKIRMTRHETGNYTTQETLRIKP